jgi:hypothetical protein
MVETANWKLDPLPKKQWRQNFFWISAPGNMFKGIANRYFGSVLIYRIGISPEQHGKCNKPSSLIDFFFNHKAPWEKSAIKKVTKQHAKIWWSFSSLRLERIKKNYLYETSLCSLYMTFPFWSELFYERILSIPTILSSTELFISKHIEGQSFWNKKKLFFSLKIWTVTKVSCNFKYATCHVMILSIHEHTSGPQGSGKLRSTIFQYTQSMIYNC